MFYELVFENGDKSIAFYEDDAEMQSAVQNHHNRAKNGEPALPLSQSFTRSDLGPEDNQINREIAAVRIKRVFAYDQHPVELFAEQGLSTDVVKSELNEFLKGDDVAHVPTLAAKVRDLTNPLVEDAGRQDSQYKAEGKEVNLDWLED